MTNDRIRDEIIMQIVQSCASWATPDQQRMIESALVVALYDVRMEKETTELSTDFARPNDWYLKQFLAIKAVKGLSAQTLNFYKITVENFFNEIPKPMADITSNDIRYYLAIREKRDHVSKTTLGNELRNLRSFFATMTAEEWIARNPTAKIDAVKKEKVIRKPFTEMEMEQIRQACNTRRGANKKKMLAIVETLYSTGCRISELVQMNRDGIKDDRVLVTGKGKKQRWVYLNPRALIAIHDYLETRTDDWPSLFPGEKCSLWPDGTERMTIGSVEQAMRRIGKAAGVKDCHPHRFRRTAATTALRRGMPIEQVSKMLGHEQINTTQIYAITEDEEVQAAHKKYLT